MNSRVLGVFDFRGISHLNGGISPYVLQDAAAVAPRVRVWQLSAWAPLSALPS